MKRNSESDDALLIELKDDHRNRGKSVNKTRIANRRNIVATLHLHGGLDSTRNIAEHFEKVYGVKISHVTIAADLKFIKERMEANMLLTTTQRVQIELDKLANLEKLATDGLEKGAIALDDFIKAMRDIMKRRSSMMGLDKAQKIQIEDRRESELSDEELEHIIQSETKKGKRAS